MSAQLEYNLYNNNRTIDEFMRNEVFPLTTGNVAIFNMCLTNGTMGRTDQLKLRELYPGLFDAVEKFLNQKKRGNLFIYEEAGKPKVVNFFIHDDPEDLNGNYGLRQSALKSMYGYIRSDKIPSKTFVWIYDEQSNHKKMIENSIRYRLGWAYKFVALRKEPEERN